MKSEQTRDRKKHPKDFLGYYIAGALLAIVSLIVLMLFQSLLFQSPFQPIEATDTVYVSKTADGGTVVADRSGERVLRIAADGKVVAAIAAGEYTFTSVKRVTSDAKGNIYIVDGTVEKSVIFTSESVKKILPNGSRVIPLAEYHYDFQKMLQMGIVGIVPLEEGARFLYKGKDTVNVCREDGSIEHEFSVPDAYTYICAATYDTEKEILYYTTYDGRVTSCDKKGNIRDVYDVRFVKEKSAPYELSLSPEGLLYVTDIASRDILVLDPKKGLLNRIAEEGEPAEREIVYMANADYGLIAASSYDVKEFDGEALYPVYEYEMATPLKLLSALLWVLMGYLALYLLLLLLWIFDILLIRGARNTRIITVVVMGVAVLSMIIIGTLVPQFQRFLPEAIFERARLAADVTAKSIPTDSLEKIDSPADFHSEDYLAVKEAIDNVFLTGTEDAEDLYCIIYRVFDGTVVSVAAINDTIPYYTYDWEYEDSDEQRVLEYGEHIEQGNDTSTNEGSYLLVLDPIVGEGGKPVGMIEVGTDLNNVNNMVRNMVVELVINVVAIMTVAIMVILELLYFQSGREKEVVYYKKGYLPPEILRIIPFLVFFLTNLTAAFFPLYLMKISRAGNTFGLAPEILAAIPISAEVISGALLSAFGGVVLRGMGQKKGLFFSAVLMTVGLTLRIVPNIWIVTLGSFLLGAGWGVILLMVNMMLAGMPEDDKQRGFSYYGVASMAGGNAGIVLGGFLIQWVNYTTVFLITAACSLIMFWLLSRYFFKISDLETEEEETEDEKESISALGFLRNRRVIMFFLLIVVPVLIGGYFLGYMYPIVADEYGLSETNIGYSMLINAACVLVFSGYLTSFFSKKKRQKAGLFLCSIMYGLAFVVVAFLQNIPALLIALVILGVADSFGIPLQTVYYTELPESERFGYDRAIGMYSLFENFSQSIGSFVFSYVLLVGARKGLLVVTAAVVLMGLIFLLFGGNVRDTKTVKR